MAVAMELDQTLQHMSREMCEAIFFFLIFDQVGRTESAKAQGRVQSKYKFWQCRVCIRDPAQVWSPMGSRSTKGVAGGWSVVMLCNWEVRPVSVVVHQEDFGFNGVPMCFVAFW